MSYIKYFVSVISGRMYAWNSYFTPALNLIWARMEVTKSPNRIIIKHLIVASGVVLEHMFGMRSDGVGRAFTLNPKGITSDDYCRLISMLMAYFSFLYSHGNKQLVDSVKREVSMVSGQPVLVDSIWQSLVGSETTALDVLTRMNRDFGFQLNMNSNEANYFLDLTTTAYQTFCDGIK